LFSINEQKQEPYIEFVAAWSAADLEPYSGCYALKLLSLHDHVANFQVAGWSHLLFIGDQDLAAGPASIGLATEDFKDFRNHLLQSRSGRFEDGRAIFDLGKRRVTIDRRGGENKTFAPVFNFSEATTELVITLEYYEKSLKDMDLPTPAATLLASPGGDDYYRSAIAANFPAIIKALIDQNKQELIKYCRSIYGMGHGLTPTGDDLIHAAFVVANIYSQKGRIFMDLLRPDVEAFSAQTGLFGRHMLEIGRRGLTPEPFGSYLEALKLGVREARIINNMIKIGSATGFDLAIGITVAVKKCFATDQFLDR